MSLTSPPAVELHHSFAQEFPELAQPWRAAEAPQPQLIVLNDELAEELGFSPAWLRTAAGARFLTGSDLPAGTHAVAQAYAGHQFGVYVPRLGDGRALLLGEIHDSVGQPRDLHLKGSGPTPFSRGGDGLAAVGPMLREYLISEAMYHLGIPTTRSLAVTATGGTVFRESPEPGAVLARVAASHIRVGTFQYARAITGADNEVLRRLAQYTLRRHYPAALNDSQPYLRLFQEVVAAQAGLVAQWMLVGFVHGVMNTDNTTMSGETIDYGPCAFLDTFDPRAVFSSIDTQGRYAYGNQPVVMQWNLARFAEALLPLIDENQQWAIELVEAELSQFPQLYSRRWQAGMAAKLGLSGADTPGASSIIENFVRLLGESRLDYTSTFRSLAAVARSCDFASLEEIGADPQAWTEWLESWRGMQPDPRLMDRVNPIYIPRNHLVEEALSAAVDGDLGPLQDLLALLRAPYTEQADRERYSHPAPPEFGPYRTYCGT